jgi:hypothetical protein
METPRAYSSDVAFSPSVKAIQTRKGSRKAYHHVEERGSWESRVTPDLAAFIAEQRSCARRWNSWPLERRRCAAAAE